MRKEFEINGCIEVQAEITEDEFLMHLFNLLNPRVGLLVAV